MFIEPTTKQKYRVLITDSGDFVLSTAVALCVPASDELQENYFADLIPQFYKSQTVFVLMTKCDLASPESFEKCADYCLQLV